MQFNTKEFSFKDRTFVAFASDLEAFHRCREIPRSILIESARTNIIKVFAFVVHERDGEGDSVCWVYKCEDLIVRIYND